MLQGQVALVTGSSRGIGRTIAVRLAKDGADVVINHSATPAEAELTKKAVEETGRRAIVVQADVGKPADVKRLYDEAIAAFGRVDILVNNAAVQHTRPFLEMSLEEWERMMAVNVTGMFLCTQAVLPAMVERKQGVVINISSGAAFHGGGGPNPNVCYAATKAAEIGFIYAMARQFTKSGIRFNAVAPGMIDNESLVTGEVRPNPTTLLGRCGFPHEVASAVSYLCSPDASFVIGQTICVNGGHFLR